MRCGIPILCLWLIGGASGGPAPALAQEPPLILAHRGGLAEFEENTLDAFRSCYENGVRGFETDIRMTKDGELVVLHDDSLDRTHRATGPVEHLTASELREILTRKTGQPFLFLEELLEYFADKPGIVLELELKTRNHELYPAASLEKFCRKLHAAALARKPEESTYIFTSFDDRPLRILHSLDPQASLSLITSKPCTAEFLRHAREIGANRIACRMDGLTRAAVREAQQAGLLVNGWPGLRLEDYHLALGLGVDVHCTDIPLAAQALANQLVAP